MATRPPDASADTLFDLMASHRITAIIHVAARLGIADHLACGPMSAAELARKTGADMRSLQRLLRALVTIGICRETDERFELTEVGAHLAEKSERSLKAFALFEGEILWRGWSGLIDFGSHRKDRLRARRSVRQFCIDGARSRSRQDIQRGDGEPHQRRNSRRARGLRFLGNSPTSRCRRRPRRAFYGNPQSQHVDARRRL